METPQPAPRRQLSIRGANLTLLLSLVLFVSLGLWLQSLSILWGTIGTEVLAILAPVLLYLAIRRLPLAETLRLRWPGWPTIFFTAILGLGLMLAASYWGAIVSRVVGYDLPVPPEFYPQTAGQAALLLAALVIAAPLCEEALFRGIILRSHERNGAWRGILVSAVLFAGFHLSLLRFIVLLPVAVVLGYVAWRTRSLITSIVLHAVYNGVSGVLSIVNGIRPDIPLDKPLGSPLVMLAAVLLLAAGIWGIIRASGERPAPRERDKRGWLGRSWPLLPAALVVVIVMAAEVVIGTQPQLLAMSRLQFARGPAEGTFDYRVYDANEQVIGEAQAEVRPVSDGWKLNITSRPADEGADAQAQPLEQFAGEYRWAANTLWVESATIRLGTAESPGAITASNTDAGLVLSQDSGTQAKRHADNPDDTLVRGEWPWRMTALTFSALAASQVDLADLASAPEAGVLPELGSQALVLQVQGAEPLAVPAGNYIAWRVTLGNRTAWYDSQGPHALLRYDDGTTSLRLANAP